MEKRKYSIGIDYGTQSGRVLLVDVRTGEEIATSVTPYKHGVIETYLPETKVKLGHDWALQHPDDYVDVLVQSVPDVLKKANIQAEDVIGIGIDFTSCTILPVKGDGTPLCKLPAYKENPHSWVKLWKHHAAQKQANKLNEIAAQREEVFLHRYGGKISSEWMIPKIMQIVEESPDIYDAADLIMEAGDWVVMQLTGKEARSSCSAGYKALWSKEDGYPTESFFNALDPRLKNVVDQKLTRQLYPIGHKAGELTEEMAALIGLQPQTAVSVFICDAPVALPAVGVTDPGKMVMIMGTSLCHFILSEEERLAEGICGVVEDGAMPGYYGYESGQNAVGDIFEWFVHNGVPEHYQKEAKELGVSIYELLEQKASLLTPGESGLLALDWWNGNRSVLMDADLSGILLGLTLSTKPEEIYRALIEATAFGTKMIIDTHVNAGIKVEELYACGGLSQKNKMLMQIYSDVTNRSIHIAGSEQTPALGAAIYGAVAAGKEKGGYESIVDASTVMANVKDEAYTPIPENNEIYQKLYEEYKILHDYFGRGLNDVMKRLKNIKQSEVSDNGSRTVGVR
ncbi:ribulokinase [Niallia nealsonii]|uniref:Ribulokinase n=1 Tax=Niallia nealsonii TaxID=115979 RepID=A0A2N0Z6Z6_9BACI|nr:ribulokinase [Niallia nealsonii]PKG25263.1 ribulokinase [Niallia nealsonii]